MSAEYIRMFYLLPYLVNFLSDVWELCSFCFEFMFNILPSLVFCCMYVVTLSVMGGTRKSLCMIHYSLG
jgi:hypothetical protein